MTAKQTSQPYTRDNFTWLAYLMLGFYGYLQAILGPAIPFIREELALSYTVAGLHFSAFAGGMIIAGLTGANFSQRFGRYRLFWGGGFGMALGALGIIIAPSELVSIGATFVMGSLGGYVLVMVQALLSDHHGDNSPIGLTESNIMASVFATLSPLALAFGAQQLGGWRFAFVLSIILWGTLWLIYRKTELPQDYANDKESSDERGTLPRLFWFYWALIFLGVAIEWCIVFWGADFMIEMRGFETEVGSGLMSAFFFAMIIGRTLGSRLLRYMPPRVALRYAIACLMIGFALFWLVDNSAFTVIGLFLSGLGVANLFPLGMTIAVRIGAEQVNRASSQVSLAAGFAILIIPQILGSLADVAGIFGAYGVVAILLAVYSIVLFLANRAEQSTVKA